MNQSLGLSSEEIKNRITGAYALLVSDLDCDRLSDFLIERSVISVLQWNEIKYKHCTKHERCRELLSQLIVMTNPRIWIILWEILTQNDEWALIVKEINGRRPTDSLSSDYEGATSAKDNERRNLETEENKSRPEERNLKKRKLSENTEELQDPIIMIDERDKLIEELRQKIQRSDSKIKDDEERFEKLKAEAWKEIEDYKSRLEERNQTLMDVEKNLCETTTQQLQEIVSLKQQLRRQDSKRKEEEERFAKLANEKRKEIEECKSQLVERNQELLEAKKKNDELVEPFLCLETVCKQQKEKIVNLQQEVQQHKTKLKELKLRFNYSDAELWTSIPRLIGTIETENKSWISAVAISDQELFIAIYSKPEIDVYDLFALVFRRKIKINGLKDPNDLAFCKTKNCLYIMDKSTDEIIRSTTKGKIIKRWSTQVYCECISVAFDSNIISTSYYNKVIVEYTPEGEEVHRVKLSNEDGLVHPTHAIKLRSGCFLFSHGSDDESLHRVCVIDLKVQMKMAFGEEKGSNNESLYWPGHMAINSDGSIIVNDRGNNRLLLLDTNLKFKRVLIPPKMKIYRPDRVAVDESTGRLFVVQYGKNDDGFGCYMYKHVSVYKFSP